MAEESKLKINLLDEIEKQNIKDHRVSRTRKYSLAEIILATFVAILIGAKSWNSVAAKANMEPILALLRLYLPFKNGIPTHDTFNRFFQIIKPEELEKLFKAFISFISQGQIGDASIQICIDGKTCRGSSKAGNKTIHMVSAWCSNIKCSLAQLKVEDKTNEITAMPKLLELLELDGAEVYADSMSTQVSIAKTITDKKGDYVLALKDNQPSLYEQAKRVAANYQPESTATSIESEKGFFVERNCEVFKVTKKRVPAAERWPKLATIIKITCKRTHKKTKTTIPDEILYYVASSQKDADYYLRRIQSYWSIERDLHWQLDITFEEDKSRKYAGNAAENFSRMLRLAYNCVNLVYFPNPADRRLSVADRADKIGHELRYLSQVLGAPRFTANA